eukprot:TRINITY_DN1095_c1_g1_i1.p1 TRINITY_DN1095_c1_g1~~TRINITY_DN1095_c1_g1_i1.p1  ORF type:complete len:755 (+),score=160.36 TRINITY_DN1095_c1_g1_i1:85-2349(+)
MLRAAVFACVWGVVASVTYEVTSTSEGIYTLKTGSGSVAGSLVWERTWAGMGVGNVVLDLNRTTFEEAYSETAVVAGNPNTSLLLMMSYGVPAQNSTNSTVRDFVTKGNNDDYLYKVAPGIYYVEFHSYAPYIMFAIADVNTSAFHECTVVLGISGPSGSTFSCGSSSSANLARYEPIQASTDTRGVRIASIMFYLDDALPAFFVDAYITIGVQRLYRWQQMEHTTNDIKHKNDRRRVEARTTTAFLFVCVGLGMFVWSLAAGLLLAWLVQPIPVPAKLLDKFDGPSGKVKFNTLVMSVVAVVLNFTISGAAGFTGWFVIGALYFLLMMGIAMYTCIVRIKHRKEPSPSTSVKPANVEDRPSRPDEGDEEKPEGDENETNASVTRDENWLPCRGNLAHMGRKQFILMLSYSGSMLLLVIVLLLIVYTWNVQNYVIYDRQQQSAQVEAIPPLTAKAVQFMYAWNGLATNMKLHLYTKWLTEWCGRRYKHSLSNSSKDSQIYSAFIVEYNIDMSEYNPSDYRAYRSVNEWFIRHLADGVRPLAGERLRLTSPTGSLPAGHEGLIVSPADCRMLIFPTLDKARVWIKGSSFNFAELLDNRAQWPALFQKGSMVIARLAPQDYHRFNTPMGGEVVDQWDVSGTYWSVNADAAKSKNYAFYNLRRILMIKYTKSDGSTRHVAYVAIGATCVGSVVFTYDKANPVIPPGGELGYMQFGGSTVIMLFEEGELVPDDDILYNSAKPVESFIKVGERLGKMAP